MLLRQNTVIGGAVGKKFDIDPSLWRIVDGKLYFNLHPMILEKWVAQMRKDISGSLKQTGRRTAIKRLRSYKTTKTERRYDENTSSKINYDRPLRVDRGYRRDYCRDDRQRRDVPQTEGNDGQNGGVFRYERKSRDSVVVGRIMEYDANTK